MKKNIFIWAALICSLSIYTQNGRAGNYPTYNDGSSSNIGGAWRPVKQNLTTINNHLEFYGWQLSNWDFLFKDENGSFINADETSPNQSIGINSGTPTTHGIGAWINGHFKCVMPEDFEFYQTIDKADLTAGTYKLSCLLGVQSLTSQRLFANEHVQFYGKETDYEQNKTPGEICTYAGHAVSGTGDIHYEMEVYITISEGESLKIGIRSGNKDGSGVVGGATNGNMRGWFKVDNFCLVKMDSENTSDIYKSSIKPTCFVAEQKLMVTGTDAYVVYSLNGIKVANINANVSGTTVDLLPGVYIVKTKAAETFKVVVK